MGAFPRLPSLPALPRLDQWPALPKLGRLPDFTLPDFVPRIARRLPTAPPTYALTLSLTLALGRVLPREPLQPMLGKRFAIRIRDAGLVLRFAYAERGFSPLADAEPVDLTISARLRDFIALLAREEDPDTLFFSRRLLMEGDTDLGLLVKNTLDGIELPPLQPREFLNWLRQRQA